MAGPSGRSFTALRTFDRRRSTEPLGFNFGLELSSDILRTHNCHPLLRRQVDIITKSTRIEMYLFTGQGLQIYWIDTDRNLLSLHLLDDLFQIIICDKKGHVEEALSRRAVFGVKDGNFQLVIEKKIKEPIYCLNCSNGKLLAAMRHEIPIFKRVPGDRGSYQLQCECQATVPALALCVETRGDLIVVGDMMNSITLFVYKKGAIEKLVRNSNEIWMTTVEFLDNDVYLGSDNTFNLFTVCRNSDGTTEERRELEVVGEYHLGELVNKFLGGSLVNQFRHSPLVEASSIPIVMFGTVSGVISVVACPTSNTFSRGSCNRWSEPC